jgi:hypothetical protein
MYKDNNLLEKTFRAITPESTEEALNNLPHNYIKLVIQLLTERKNAGEISKVYSKSYVTKVKQELDGAFNEDVMNAIVAVGLANIEKRKRFGIENKKTTKTN